MFTRFINPMQRLAQNSPTERTHPKTENFSTTLRHIAYTGLLASGFLLSGYNFIKNRFNQSVQEQINKKEAISENKEVQTISVVSYVHFDNREMLHKNEPRKPAIVETPHLNRSSETDTLNNNALIRGYLSDENGAKVQSADILLYKANELVAVTYTGENGEFIFPDLAPAAYSLKILRAGYKELNYPEFKLASGQRNFMEFCIESMAFANKRNATKKNLPAIATPGDNQGNISGLALTITIKNSAPH